MKKQVIGIIFVIFLILIRTCGYIGYQLFNSMRGLVPYWNFNEG